MPQSNGQRLSFSFWLWHSLTCFTPERRCVLQPEIYYQPIAISLHASDGGKFIGPCVGGMAPHRWWQVNPKHSEPQPAAMAAKVSSRLVQYKSG